MSFHFFLVKYLYATRLNRYIWERDIELLLFNFKSPQKEFEISGVKFGGNPLTRPMVMVGSLFYSKHKVVTDMAKGDFDKSETERQINLQDELSEKTGLPCALDVISSTSMAMEKFLSYVANIFDGPIFMDGSTDDVRIAGANLVNEWGLKDRIIYNSITPDYKEIELETIKAVKIISSVILAYTSTEFTSSGRIKAIKYLLPKISNAGVVKPLIDSCVIDIPSLGSASRTIIKIKDELGLPVGNGSHNAISTWRGLEKKFGKNARKPTIASAAGLTASMGGDFCLYGPLHTAQDVFPVVAMINAAQEQLGIEDGNKPNRKLPLFRIG
jgi:tetrahydromethanopterin S-methyltransferase subunit H